MSLSENLPPIESNTPLPPAQDALYRIAEFLGVAGTDVPIAEIRKLVPPYKVPFFCLTSRPIFVSSLV